MRISSLSVKLQTVLINSGKLSKYIKYNYFNKHRKQPSLSLTGLVLYFKVTLYLKMPCTMHKDTLLILDFKSHLHGHHM